MSDDELLASLRPSELRVLIDLARTPLGHGFTTARLDHGVVLDAVRTLHGKGLIVERGGADFWLSTITDLGRRLVDPAIELYKAQEALTPPRRLRTQRTSPYLPANLKKLLG
jgi:hypothetical protein